MDVQVTRRVLRTADGPGVWYDCSIDGFVVAHAYSRDSGGYVLWDGSHEDHDVSRRPPRLIGFPRSKVEMQELVRKAYE